MPAKSRRNRGKNLPPSKRIKAGTGSKPVTITNSEAETAAPAVTAATDSPAIKAKAAAEIAETVASYPHVKPELMMIGILAIVMFAILGILAAVL